MAKVRTYLRVAKTGKRSGYKVVASAKPSDDVITRAGGFNSKQPLPTVSFAVDLVIPDELFSQAERVVATIDVTKQGVKIAGRVPAAS